MDDNQKIVIGGSRRDRRQKNSYIKKEEDSFMFFQEKMAAIVGPSYVAAGVGGAFYGMTMRVTDRQRRTTRILLNTFMNNIGKNASRFANNTAAAVLLYVATGKLINFIFFEELEDLKISNLLQSGIYGGVTGAIYKSTRGFRPMMLSMFLGATIGCAYSYAWSKGLFSVITNKGLNQAVAQQAQRRH